MDLPELTVTEAQAAFACGEWTSLRLCEAYLQRIATIDQAGPMLDTGDRMMTSGGSLAMVGNIAPDAIRLLRDTSVVCWAMPT